MIETINLLVNVPCFMYIFALVFVRRGGMTAELTNKMIAVRYEMRWLAFVGFLWKAGVMVTLARDLPVWLLPVCPIITLMWLFWALIAWNDKNDRWKKRRKKMLAKVKAVAGRLVVVPPPRPA